jgi:hypothetical protein
MFDAVSIEYAFAYLLQEHLGERGTPNDADVFRSGDPASLAKVIEASADALEKRIGSIKFDPIESESGGSKARLGVAIRGLKSIAKDMRSTSTDEPNDYHWIIIGEYVGALAALLDHIEGKGHPHSRK